MADPNMTLALRIQADLKQADQALDALGQQLNQTGQQAQQTNAQLGVTSVAVDQLGTETTAATVAVEAISNALDQAGAQAQQSTPQINATTGAVDQLGAESTAAATAVATVANALDQAGDQAQQASAQVNAASSAVDRLGAESAASAAAVKGVGAAATTSAAGLAQQAAAMQRAGLTAGQYQQAMRMLPMQLTDVVTSLASGMPLWMVAIQQGGQVRDSFGGIGNAARAVVSAINPMAAGVALGVAALAGLGMAYYEGSQEATRFNEALILTGGYARMTAGDLTGLAQKMDALDGVTQSSASAALTQVAASGKFAGEQIELVAVAAEQMRVATGKAIEETIAEFVKLRGDPVKAILDLNDQYHFLSRSQLEQIRSLQEQGRHQDAVTEAVRVYAGVIAERTPQIVENLGWIEEGWRAIKKGARETLDDVLSIGRAVSPQQRINDLLAERYRLQANENRILMSPAQKKAVQERIAAINAEIKSIQDKRVEEIKAASAPSKTVDSDAARARMQAEQDFERLALSNLDKRAKLEREIADIRELGLKAGKDQAEIDKQIAAARARYEESLPKARKTAERAYTDDAATRMLQQLRNQEASLASQLTTNDKLSAAQRAQVEWTQQLADLKGKDILTAEQKSLLANEQAITAQLAQNAALDAQIRKLTDVNALTQRAAQINQSMASALEGQQDQNQRELDGYGQGRQARERIESERAIRAEYQRYQDELNEATPKDLLGSSEHLAASADIQRGLTAALDENVAAYDRLIQKQGDWSVGASEAFANYMAEAQNIAGQTEYMVGSALESLTQGIGDSFAQAIVYGDDLRATMAGVAQTILSEVLSALIQMGVRYGINAMMQAASIQTVTAAQVAADATRTASAVAATATVTAAQTAAAATTATAWAPAAMTASIGSFGTAAAIGIAAVVAAMALANGFATGGEITGPGTDTSDSIPAWLSNGEFVTREAVVSQPGALGFLHDFNSRGMAALDDWATRVRHSTGGLAGVPAPSLPAPSLGSAQLAEPAKALGGATVQNAVNLYAVQDESQVASMAWGKSGQEHFLVYLQRNSQTVKSILKV